MVETTMIIDRMNDITDPIEDDDEEVSAQQPHLSRRALAKDDVNSLNAQLLHNTSQLEVGLRTRGQQFQDALTEFIKVLEIQ